MFLRAELWERLGPRSQVLVLQVWRDFTFHLKGDQRYPAGKRGESAGSVIHGCHPLRGVSTSQLADTHFLTGQ